MGSQARLIPKLRAIALMGVAGASLLAFAACGAFGTTTAEETKDAALESGSIDSTTDAPPVDGTVSESGVESGSTDGGCIVVFDHTFDAVPSNITGVGGVKYENGIAVLTTGAQANDRASLWSAPFDRLKKLTITVDYIIEPVDAATGQGLAVSWVGQNTSPALGTGSYGICGVPGSGRAVVVDSDLNDLMSVNAANCATNGQVAGDLIGVRTLIVEVFPDRVEGRVGNASVTHALTTVDTGRVVVSAATTNKLARHAIDRVKVERCD